MIRRRFRKSVSNELNLDFSGQVLDPRLVFSREGSVATRFKPNGLLEEVGPHVPRFDHLITSGAWRGLLLEKARTNVVLHNRDLTNAAWTKTNITAAKDQTGIDGVSNSASKITATAGNGTCLQAITLASSARYQTAYVKRVTGTGTVNMTMDNGGTWTVIAVTSAWTRLSIPTQTIANPTVGFRLVTSGDAIAVDFVQNEDGAYATSAIAVAAAAVTRSADLLTLAFDQFGWFNPNEGTFVLEWVSGTNSGDHVLAFIHDSTNYHQVYCSSVNVAGQTIVGAAQASILVTPADQLAQQVKHKAAYAYKTNSFMTCVDGVTGGPDTDGAVWTNSPVYMSLGSQSGGFVLDGWLRTVRFYNVRKTDAQLQALTTPLYPAETNPFVLTAMTSLTRPTYLAVIDDPDSNTKIRRITDFTTFGVTTAQTNPTACLKHNYAKNQPWNSDGTLLLLHGMFPGFMLDGQSYAFIKRFNQPSDAVWSNTNPNLLYGVQSSNQSMVSALASGNGFPQTTLRVFTGYTSLRLGGGEGNLSDDDRYAALLAVNGSGAETIIVYDVLTDTIVSATAFPSANIDNVTMSHSGTYVVAQFIGGTGAPGGTGGHKCFDRAGNFLRTLTTATSAGGHADVAYDTAGNEVVCWTDTVDIFSARLSDATLRNEGPAGGANHISGRNINRPGYLYVSEFEYDMNVNPSWESYHFKPIHNTVVALKLDGSGTVEKFCKEHHAVAIGSDRAYERSCMGVPNRNGSIVLWSSDWESATVGAEIHTYVSYAG
jgi:hypothetical protein